MKMDQNENDKNNWSEYSRMVLNELESLGMEIRNMNREIQEVKKEIALLKDREDKVSKLSIWKDKMTEVVSPTQLEMMVKEISELKEFKIKAITVFSIVQALMVIVTWLINYLK